MLPGSPATYIQFGLSCCTSMILLTMPGSALLWADVSVSALGIKKFLGLETGPLCPDALG